MTEITLHLGQPVLWPASSIGIAQICELRTRKVRLCYFTRRGTVRYALVHAGKLVDALHGILPIHNPMGRGVLANSKTYRVDHPHS